MMIMTISILSALAYVSVHFCESVLTLFLRGVAWVDLMNLMKLSAPKDLR